MKVLEGPGELATAGVRQGQRERPDTSGRQAVLELGSVSGRCRTIAGHAVRIGKSTGKILLEAAQVERPPHLVDRLLVAALLEVNQSDQVERMRVVGVQSEGLAEL